jgi:hypothetical protein
VRQRGDCRAVHDNAGSLSVFFSGFGEPWEKYPRILLTLQELNVIGMYQHEGLLITRGGEEAENQPNDPSAIHRRRQLDQGPGATKDRWREGPALDRA